MNPIMNPIPTSSKLEHEKKPEEKLVHLDAGTLPGLHINLALYKGMNPENQLYLRAGVVDRLIGTQKYLDKVFPDLNLQIEIRSAFRTAEDYLSLKAEHENRYDDWTRSEDLAGRGTKEEYVNSMLAKPGGINDPGHMTGGAVDVRIRKKDGTFVHLEESTGIPGHIPRPNQVITRSPEVAEKFPEMMRFRMVLLEAMESQGFHNNKDEYWHYSYGDADWAKANNCKPLYTIEGIPDSK